MSQLSQLTAILYPEWKGDYIDLGAGEELRIYEKGIGPHWYTGTQYAMPMTLELFDQKGNLILERKPDEPNWWITGFTPAHQNVLAKDLTAVYTLDFSSDERMYEAFNKSWKKHESWSFDPKKYTATLHGRGIEYMNKYIIAVSLAASLVLLSSCLGRGTVYSDDGQKANARLEQVIEAIENRDKIALRAMFSQQALAEAEELDERMDYLFDFIQGDIELREELGGTVYESVRGGRTVKESKYLYTVTTDIESYLFFLYEYTVNTEYPENVGLYMLQVIQEEDRDTQFDGGQDILCAGIYRPEE